MRFWTAHHGSNRHCVELRAGQDPHSVATELDENPTRAALAAIGLIEPVYLQLASSVPELSPRERFDGWMDQLGAFILKILVLLLPYLLADLALHNLEQNFPPTYPIAQTQPTP